MHGQNMIARLNKATHNYGATLFLLRLNYWSRQSCAISGDDGRHWVANSRDEWSEELGMSPSVAKRVLKVLNDAHLIETRMGMHRKRWVMQVRMTQRAVTISAGGEGATTPPIPDQNTTPQELKPDPVPGANSPLLYTESKQGEKQIEKHSGAEDPAPEQIACSSSSPGKKEMIKAKSAHDVAGAVKAQQKLHGPDKAQALSVLWREWHHETKGVLLVLKQKEEMQLRQFWKLCPPGRAYAILQKVLAHWLSFSKFVESNAGITHSPALPNTGFLLQNASLAVLWASPGKNSLKVLKQEAEKPLETAGAVQLIAKDEEKPATLEEVLAILSDDGSEKV